MVLRLCKLQTYGIAPTREPDRTVGESGHVEFDLMVDDPCEMQERIAARMGLKPMAEAFNERFERVMAERLKRRNSVE